MDQTYCSNERFLTFFLVMHLLRKILSSLWLNIAYEYIVETMKAKVSVILAALLSISLAGEVFVNQNSGSLHFQKGIDFGVKPFKKGLAGFKRTESFACTGNRFSRFFTAEKCSNFNCLA